MRNKDINENFEKDYIAYTKDKVTVTQLAVKYDTGYYYIRDQIKQYGGMLSDHKIQVDNHGLKLNGISFIIKRVTYAESSESLKGITLYCSCNNQLRVYCSDDHFVNDKLLSSSINLGPLTLECDRQKIYDMVYARYDEILAYRKAKKIEYTTKLLNRTCLATPAEHEKLKAYLEKIRMHK